MSQMLWARAVWMEGFKTIEDTIPKIWINEDKKIVYWPFKVSYIKAVKQWVQPAEDWKKFKLIKVKIVDEDRDLCIGYDYTTAESETEIPTSKAPKRRKDNDDSDPDLSPVFQRISPRNKTPSSKKMDLPGSPLSPLTPSPPKMKKKIVLPSPGPSPIQTKTNKRLNSPRLRTSSPKARHQKPSTSSSSSASSSPAQSSSKHTILDKQSSNTSQNIDNDGVRQIINLHKKTLKFLLEIQNDLKSFYRSNDPESVMAIDSINTEEELEEMEENLKDRDYRKRLRNQLAGIRGVDCKDHARQALRRLFAPIMPPKMNINGNKGKIALGKKKTFKVLKDCVLKRFKDASEMLIKNTVATVLRNAPVRISEE